MLLGPIGPVNDEQVESYLALELVASEPYSRFVYDDETVAAAAHRHLFATGVGEFAAPHAKVLVVDDMVLGVAAWLSGANLRDSRLRAAVALTKGGFFRDDPDLRRRMRLAAEALMVPRLEDLYLSRLAVDLDARGRGIGVRLVSEFESDAHRQVCRRLVLEVSPEHEAARALYDRAGFVEIDSRKVSDPETQRELRYIHMARDLKGGGGSPSPLY